MSDQELKPCPFCGAEVLGPCGADYYGPFYIIKHKKDCFFPTISGQHVTRIRERSGKINVWSTRTLDPMPEELAEKVADHYCNDELLKEMAGALQWISEDGHAMASMIIGSRNRLLAALQKYQQSKVKP